ncbi:MAG: hypothetical protein GY813_09320 [Halieaceae bacterium]|nr:hypothetical protein [Halieaceae bacterium]
MNRRRVNNLTTRHGEHITLTRVHNDADLRKYYGFGLTDAGEEVYLSSSLVRQEDMTEEDIGAGMTVVLKPAPEAEGSRAARVAVGPMTWDGDDDMTDDFMNLVSETRETYVKVLDLIKGLQVKEAAETLRRGQERLSTFQVNMEDHFTP